MTLPKRKSRKITCNDETYRFQVSCSKTEAEGKYTLNLTIEREEGGGSILRVIGLVTRDFWLDFSSFHAEVKKEEYPVITPKNVSNVIHEALNMGWKPTLSGKPFEITLQNNELFQ